MFTLLNVKKKLNSSKKVSNGESATRTTSHN